MHVHGNSEHTSSGEVKRRRRIVRMLVDAATMEVGVKQGRPGNRPGVWVSGMQMLMQLDFLGGNSLTLFTIL